MEERNGRMRSWLRSLVRRSKQSIVSRKLSIIKAKGSHPTLGIDWNRIGGGYCPLAVVWHWADQYPNAPTNFSPPQISDSDWPVGGAPRDVIVDFIIPALIGRGVVTPSASIVARCRDAIGHSDWPRCRDVRGSWRHCPDWSPIGKNNRWLTIDDWILDCARLKKTMKRS